MRLAVVIPAYNEEKSIADVIRDVPRTLSDVDDVMVIVTDDGSTDATASLAAKEGAKVIRHVRRSGLAAAYRSGVQAALLAGADLICTLDADGQYRPQEMEQLLATLRRDAADLVVGDRDVWRCPHMPFGNRLGNSVGSFMLRILGTTKVADASSGFRLFTAPFARCIRITSEHTYTHEMLIQASAAGSRVSEVRVSFLPREHGKSKLVRTLRHHILRSCGTIVRSLFLYRPLRKFLFLAFLCIAGSATLFFFGLRDGAAGALAMSGILLLLGVQFVLIGVLADTHASARRMLLEDIHHDSVV